MPFPHSLRIRADWIFASRDCILAPGVITIQHGQVAQLEMTSSVSGEPVDLDLEGYALIPGLVNPHTHLEFSDLPEPLPAGENFPAWIGRVIRQRMNRGTDAQQLLTHSLTQGLVESRDAGVVLLADIVTPPWTPSLLDKIQLTEHNSPFTERLLPRALERYQAHMPSSSGLPKVIACMEVLGVTGDRAQMLRQWRDDMLTINAAAGPRLVDLALSPHAPYSTPVELWRESAALAARDARLLVMHLAESPAERQWIDEGSGPMAEMLERIGASSHRPAADWIEQAIETLAQAPRGLIVHGNYLSPTEIDHIAVHRDKLSVVYCPRTHQHFGHAVYPLEQLIARGIRVVLGTDSRSSNPDLNLWREAAQAIQQHACLRPSRALEAITQSAAEALGVGPRFGTLMPGAIAAMNALPTFGLSNFEEILSQNFDDTESVVRL